MQLPGPLRERIEQELSACDSRRLREAASKLSERYRHADFAAESSRPPALMDDLDRAAYLAVRMPATYAAIAAALRWTLELCREIQAEIRSMLDLGSGPGTALWAAAQMLPALASATAVERDPHLIEIGRRLAARSEHIALREAEWLCGDLTDDLPLPQQAKSGLAGDPRQSKYGLAGDPLPHQSKYGLAGGPAGCWDLVVCAYALNEIGKGHRARLVRQAWARCSKLLIIVEPGTKSGFTNIIAVRNQMLVAEAEPESAPMLVAPCPHSLECPMVAAEDWCHFAARVERTSSHRRLKSAELGHEDEKFSYVAFIKGEQQQEAGCPKARIVRHPRIFSGYAQLTLCTGRPSAPEAGVLGQSDGRLEQTTVTRSQKEEWRRLKRLGWGDLW